MKLENKVKQTLKKIKINKKEKILVALSGGKDSVVVAYLLKKFGYNIEGLYVDLCVGEYSKKCLEVIKELCLKLEIKLHVYDMKKKQGKTMKDIWKKHPRLNHCSTCGVFKKWILNREARRLKTSKIATGHNLDDEAQTILINIFKGSPGLNLNSGAITKNILNKKFIPRIKPLYYVAEEDVLKYVKKNKLPFLDGKCPYAQESYRIEVRNFLETMPSKDKLNIIKNFEKISENIKKDVKINYCEICGEASRNKLCKKCSLLRD